MSFMKRLVKGKVGQFSELIQEKKTSVFIFGSNDFAMEFITHLIDAGAANTVALIAEEERLWIEDVEETITVLIQEKKKDYKSEKFYKSLGFEHAEKIIILFESGELIQDVMSGVRSQTKAQVITLQRFAPPFLTYVSRLKGENTSIIDDVNPIVQRLIRSIDVDIEQPPVIQVPASDHLIGKQASSLEFPDLTVIGIVKADGTTNLPDQVIEEDDEVLIYLCEPDAIKTVVTQFRHQ
ncbi:MAG: TrkA C-terminal domain-containing protein [Candidatus Thorarchaeota archaeon]